MAPEDDKASPSPPSRPALPGGAEEYVRDSISFSLGLPVPDRSLRLKLLASEDLRRRLQDHVFALEEDLYAAARRIDLLKKESVMNAEGIRRCVEEKEAVAAARDRLAADVTRLEKEVTLYERDLERAMESCDDLARENEDLRARLKDNPDLPLACFILVCLFALQHYGTHRVGFLFAPIVIAWLVCISSIGVYNIVKWEPHVYRALSPYYMYKFLKKTQRGGWMSLGGILLCVTGSEAMFADLGHFNQLSIQIAFTCMVYPSLILAYMGQAAYLSKHHILEGDYRIGFYVSVPGRRSGAGGGQEPILAPTVLLVLMAWSWPPSPRTRALQLLGFNYVDYFLGSCRRVMAATVASVALFYISVF